MPREDQLIVVTQTGILGTERKINRAVEAVHNPPLHKMVQGMAGIWQSNFASEGQAVGGWRQLTPMTNELRLQRGYPAEHPILVQSGALRRAAIDGLLNVNGPRVLTYKGVMMSYRPGTDSATLEISGPKVDNQFRIRNADFSSPPRPFWFVNTEVEQAAVAALQQYLDSKIGK